MPTATLSRSDARKFVQESRSEEWKANERLWRWLLHSWEGGDVYRRAVYAMDSRGQPVRNLVRHKREYPAPRDNPGYNGFGYGNPNVPSTDDDYELRLARTPVPTFVSEAIECYMGKIFAHEIDRDIPTGSPFDLLDGWWKDVDGLGTSIDEWMRNTVGPLLTLFGCLDLAFDHPPAPEDVELSSRAVEEQYDLGSCVASYILPDNMVWWRLDPLGKNYLECLVREYQEDGECYYRHWTETESTLYDEDGEVEKIVPHSFGVVPIVRVFDRRRAGCRNVGKPRLESVAERMREYYNRDSELILSDTIQAHPILQAPAEYIVGDAEITIGPGYILPKRQNNTGGMASYEPWEVLDFPKGAAESLRENKQDIRDDVDRDAKLMKPAGTAGKGTVSQSGISKLYDLDDQHATLVSIAKSFAKAEHAAAHMALIVLTDGKPPKDLTQVEITYPTVFGLHTAEDLAAITENLQLIVENAGNCPLVETALVNELVRKGLQGYPDDQYDQFEKEIAATIQEKARQKAQLNEAAVGAAQLAAEPDPTVLAATPIGSTPKEARQSGTY